MNKVVLHRVKCVSVETQMCFCIFFVVTHSCQLHNHEHSYLVHLLFVFENYQIFWQYKLKSFCLSRKNSFQSLLLYLHISIHCIQELI